MKKSLVIAVIVLTVSALGAGVVGAQGPDNAPRLGNRGPRDGGAMDVISEATGLTVLEIREALQEEGATLASVIEANGGDVEAVRAQLIENATTRLEEQAASVEERIDNLLNSEFAGRGGRGPGGFGFGFGGERLETVAELVGTDVDTLAQSLRDGQTIAEIAQANSVDPQTVIDTLVTAAGTRIDEAVANDRISAEDGEARKADLAENIADFVNNTGDHLLGGGRFGGGFDGPRGGRGPGGNGNGNGNGAQQQG